MFHTNNPEINRTYYRHQELCRDFGAKAAGLWMIPAPWRLDFAAISQSLHEYWKSSGTVTGAKEFLQLIRWLDSKSYRSIILRSSGVHEILYDRGKYKSRLIQDVIDRNSVATALEDIFIHASQVDESERLAIVVQEYRSPAFAGHLSNENRVSPTINQWVYELEMPSWAPSKGLNSKFTTSPDPASPLKCGRHIPHQPLRSIAHFLADEFGERCHVEWLVSNETLYIAQIDLEWPEQDHGFEPRKDVGTAAPPTLDLSKQELFAPYIVGSDTKWPKLKNLSDFDFAEGSEAPRIYSLSPCLVRKAQSDTLFGDELIAEMTALTGDRLVVRTDCVDTGVNTFNLPRTDTVSARHALDWCVDVVGQFDTRNVQDESYMFLFHAFLPARASAWAYASPESPIVIIDALWGLPDGLQVLPVDTYEVNTYRAEVVQTRSTFKPKFLTELEDGRWDYQKICSRFGRSQVLNRAAKLEVAKRTKLIADKLCDDAQIMWFCDIPSIYQVGQNLPWFRSREKLDKAPRQEEKYRPYLVSTMSDLSRLPGEKVTLKLSPQADLIRDENFLNSIIEIAKARSLPVELEGSILGHTYYRLSKERIPVILSNEPKYYRARKRKTFGKIVRDKIPSNIAAGGESVREAKLAKADLTVALSGKLLEEIEELIRATGVDEISEELADIFEVLLGIASSCDVSWAGVSALARKKRQRRGGFKDGRILLETALPRRNSPLETQQSVRLAELVKVTSTEVHAEIPASSLMATARGPGVIFNFENDSMRYRVALKGGRLQITKVGQRDDLRDESQLNLFD